MTQFKNIAAQAMASMHLNLPHKLNQHDLPDAKECVKQVMNVMSDLPEVPDVISKSKLKKNMMQTGNINFFCHVINLSSSNISLVWFLHLIS